MSLVRFFVGLSLLTLVIYLIYLFILAVLNTPVSVFFFAMASTVLIFIIYKVVQKKEAQVETIYRTKKDWIVGFFLTLLLVTFVCVLAYDFLSGTSVPICNPELQECQDLDSNIP